MRCLLSRLTAKNNEEYKEIIKFRMNISLLMILIGIITITVTLFVGIRWFTGENKHMIAAYTGAGSGLMFASIVLWIKNKKLLTNDIKLKETRLSDTDERLQAINNKAFRMASIVLLVALYLVGFIGGLFYPILFKVLIGIVFIFLITYVLAYKIYEKKM